MIYVSTNNLKPGMILAKDIWGKSSCFPLIHIGTTLGVSTIKRLIDKGIQGVYIECEGCEDIEVNEIISMEEKIRITDEIGKIFKSLQAEKGNIFACVESVSKIADYFVDVVTKNHECLMNIIDIKNYNEYSYVHSMQVGILSTIIGNNLGYKNNRLKELATAGMLHDVGKLNIPIEILDKAGPLTDEEFAIMKKHPDYGIAKLSTCHGLSKDILDGIVTHHEKIDGTGYPRGLKEDEIHVFGKIIAVADVYDALTSDRSYRKSWTPHDTINYMMSCAGNHFDVDILSAFLLSAAAYPVDVLVLLSNGLKGVVINTVAGLPLNPIVKILTPGEHHGEIFDLANDIKYLTIKILDTISDPEEIECILAENKIYSLRKVN
ncbi:MAG: HD-GYP domain-containing protein [Lachnospiraceae bacterium]|nr:HD-GYP domain-containing protein [Lachnospiraceae bacterium]